MVAGASAVRPNAPIVDAHVHILPDEILQAVQEWFTREVSWTLPDVTTAKVAEFIEIHMDGSVIFPYAHRPGVARSMNETVAHWQERLENTVGLATVHAGDVDPVAIIREGLDAGLQGVKLHCPVQEFPPDDQRLDAVYELAVSRDLPTIIHASSHPFYRDSEIVGPEPTARLLARFPNLRLCIPHLGLFETHDFLDLADRYDTLVFDTAVAIDDTVHDLIGVRESEFPADRLRTYADRIMFGTDYPTFPVSVPYTNLVDAAATLFSQNQDAIFYDNAREFYGLEKLSP
jgi:predicted TIM-barrel fold metal-dependent hydrolase